MTKIYLGGTWNESTWREKMISYLSEKEIDWFNPIVSDWTEECRAQEIRERECCDFVLYTITPKMTGVYSIAEAVDDSNKKPDKTILVLLQKDEGLSFSKSQWKSLEAVADIVRRNGGHVFYDLKSAAVFIGKKKRRIIMKRLYRIKIRKLSTCGGYERKYYIIAETMDEALRICKNKVKDIYEMKEIRMIADKGAVLYD